MSVSHGKKRKLAREFKFPAAELANQRGYSTADAVEGLAVYNGHRSDWVGSGA